MVGEEQEELPHHSYVSGLRFGPPQQRLRLARLAIEPGNLRRLIGAPDTSEARNHADSTQSLAARVEELMHQAKLDRKDALKLAAKERGLTRRAAYAQIVDTQTHREES
jgi:hypothetical protein